MTTCTLSSCIPGAIRTGIPGPGISTSYLSLADSSGLNIQASDDADDACWFTVTYRVFSEQKTMDGEDRTIERFSRLTLRHENQSLSAILRHTLVAEGKLGGRPRLKIRGNSLDHARIIALA